MTSLVCRDRPPGKNGPEQQNANPRRQAVPERDATDQDERDAEMDERGTAFIKLASAGLAHESSSAKTDTHTLSRGRLTAIAPASRGFDLGPRVDGRHAADSDRHNLDYRGRVQ